MHSCYAPAAKDPKQLTYECGLAWCLYLHNQLDIRYNTCKHNIIDIKMCLLR